jgi:hypothetical protein
MPEQPSIEALLAERVAVRVAELVRAELAPIRSAIDAIVASSPPTLIDLAEALRRGLIPSMESGRRWAASGVVPARKLGRKWLLDAAALRPLPPEQIARLAREAREDG